MLEMIRFYVDTRQVYWVLEWMMSGWKGNVNSINYFEEKEWPMLGKLRPPTSR